MTIATGYTNCSATFKVAVTANGSAYTISR